MASRTMVCKGSAGMTRAAPRVAAMRPKCVPSRAVTAKVLKFNSVSRKQFRMYAAAEAAEDAPAAPAAPEAPAAEIVVATPAEVDSADMSVADIKAALLDSLYGTERGLAARSEIRAEINELISQLEAQNPTPSPAETLDALTGEWKLVYTSASEALAVLALSRLPFVTIGDITQKIDSVTNTVENKVSISVPLSRTAFSTTASFEVRSPKRLQLRVESGKVHTPQLLSEIDLPSSVTVLGQSVDLVQVKSALEPVNERIKGLLDQVGGFISQQPDLQIPISVEQQPQTWLLTTYLDEDTRITRGDGGSVFILVKEVSLAE